MDAVQYVYWMQLQQVTLFSLSIHHGISLNPPSRVYVSLEIVTQNFVNNDLSSFVICAPICEEGKNRPALLD